MSFPDAIKAGLAGYVTFSGRSRRSEYWYFFLFVFLVSLAAVILDSVLGLAGTVGPYGPFEIVLLLASILPGLAIGIRRLHDTDRSGWWILLGLIPVVGTIILIVWYCTDGTPGPNQFGNSPKPLLGGPEYTDRFNAPPPYGQPGGYDPNGNNPYGPR